MRAPGANSFGAAFNGAGGGWYAMERTNAFVKVWFWSRGAGNVPSEVRNGATTINTGNWVSAVLRYAAAALRCVTLWSWVWVWSGMSVLLRAC